MEMMTGLAPAGILTHIMNIEEIAQAMITHVRGSGGAGADGRSRL